MPAVYERIVNLLDANGIAYRSLEHAPVRTSEEAAQLRGMSMRMGAKAIVMKVGETFSIFVISAAQQIDAKRLRKHFGSKRSRFATREELLRLTDLEPGAVPPFGRPVFDLDLYADSSITEVDDVAFNAGLHTTSIIMQCSDWMAVARPTVLEYASSQA